MNENLPQAPQGEFVLFQSADGRTRVECRFEADTLWLSQAAMAELYQVSSQAITQHIKAIYEEGELVQNLTCKDYLQVQSEGNRTVQRKIRHYSLPVILSVGYRVRSTRGTQFRQWATARLGEFLVKGFTMDDERLKKLGGGGYWKELLERIRDIQTLLNKVNDAPDAKDIADLQGRIQAETAMLQNEQAKISMMVKLQEIQEKKMNHIAKEISIRNINKEPMTGW